MSARVIWRHDCQVSSQAIDLPIGNLRCPWCHISQPVQEDDPGLMALARGLVADYGFEAFDKCWRVIQAERQAPENVPQMWSENYLRHMIKEAVIDEVAAAKAEMETRS